MSSSGNGAFKNDVTQLEDWQRQLFFLFFIILATKALDLEHYCTRLLKIYSGHEDTTNHELCLHLRKFVHTNLPLAGFEFRSLGPQACVLPIEPPLLAYVR